MQLDCKQNTSEFTSAGKNMSSNASSNFILFLLTELPIRLIPAVDYLTVLCFSRNTQIINSWKKTNWKSGSKTKIKLLHQEKILSTRSGKQRVQQEVSSCSDNGEELVGKASCEVQVRSLQSTRQEACQRSAERI